MIKPLPIKFGTVLFVTGAIFALFLVNRSRIVLPVLLSKQDRIDLAIEQEYALTKNPVSGTVPRERLIQALELRDDILRRKSSATSRAVPGITWSERGPNNIAGRTRALLFDANDAGNGYKKVWAGSVGGGLWFTNDITASVPLWNKVDDLMDNLAITAIAQNPLNGQELYAGTGEGWFNFDAIKGLGIWKSVNGGASWTRLVSTENFGYINDLLIDKNGRLYASVRPPAGSVFNGIQKSIDGGNSWTQVLGTGVFGSSARGGDLEMGATGDVYASLGTTGSNGGVYRSDFGTNALNTGNAGTWVNITPDSAGTVATPSGKWHRIELATAPSDANIMYALFQGAGQNNCTSIQQYNKATNSWSVKTVPTIIDQGSNSNFARGQAWYNLIAAVDPQNAGSLYIGGIDAVRSDDSGSTWTQMTTWSLFAATGFTSAQNVHADHHGIMYAPGSSSRAIWGTDGGIHYTATANSTLPAKPVFMAKNMGYNVTQYYSTAIHPLLNDYFLAGAQDNGSQKFTAAGINTTATVSGGDGGFCHIDQDDPNIQITSFVFNNYYVSINGGASFVTRSF
ncbi:MAG: sialidase family protein, partial [Chitinophagaceae bacterium]